MLVSRPPDYANAPLRTEKERERERREQKKNSWKFIEAIKRPFDIDEIT